MDIISAGCVLETKRVIKQVQIISLRAALRHRRKQKKIKNDLKKIVIRGKSTSRSDSNTLQSDMMNIRAQSNLLIGRRGKSRSRLALCYR